MEERCREWHESGGKPLHAVDYAGEIGGNEEKCCMDGAAYEKQGAEAADSLDHSEEGSGSQMAAGLLDFNTKSRAR